MKKLYLNLIKVMILSFITPSANCQQGNYAWYEISPTSAHKAIYISNLIVLPLVANESTCPILASRPGVDFDQLKRDLFFITNCQSELIKKRLIQEGFKFLENDTEILYPHAIKANNSGDAMKSYNKSFLQITEPWKKSKNPVLCFNDLGIIGKCDK